MPTSHLTKTKLSKYKGSRHKIEPMQIDSQKFDYNDMHRQEDMHTYTYKPLAYTKKGADLS
jgi:hypothetical protein